MTIPGEDESFTNTTPMALHEFCLHIRWQRSIIRPGDLVILIAI
ncbi:MAG: hypothetical protein RQ982_09315 [Gammaproteobacteria bacterium]|nr:hypothetical protein [Gammaproteobacteria bacterium]